MNERKNCWRDTLQDIVAGTLLGALIGSTPITALTIRNYFQALGDPPYKTIVEVKEDLEREKKRLDLEGVLINIMIKPQSFLSLLVEGSTAYTIKENNGTYRIVLREGEGRSVLRHELWHVYQLETRPRPVGLGKLFNEWEAQDYVEGSIRIKPR